MVEPYQLQKLRVVDDEAKLNKTALEKTCITWFLKPLTRNIHLSLGGRDKKYVLSSLKYINLFDSDVYLEHYQVGFGLVQFKDFPWLASSIDGCMVLNIDGEYRDVVIEINTMSVVASQYAASK